MENYTAEVTIYNDYNFDIYIGGGYLLSDYLEEPTLFSNETGNAGIALNLPGGFVAHPGKSEMVFNLNFSFSQAELEWPSRKA